MKLHNLVAPAPNKQTRKRLGRGEGSGLGQQSGRGHKGQKSVSGNSQKIGFEGGQMPLQRRVPKYGFKNPFRVEYHAVNLNRISEAIESGKLGTTINVEALVAAGLVKKNKLVKVLGVGELTKAITVEVHAFSQTASDKIQQAGGSISAVNK